MAMDKDAMKAKIVAAYTARTGKTMSEGDFNAIVDLCEGIIQEIISGAVVSVTVSGGSSAGVHTGVITS